METIKDTDLKGNTVLRRYINLTKYISFLQTKSLFFNRADNFEDKFEGAFTPSLRKMFIDQLDDSLEYNTFKSWLRELVYINCWTLGANDNMALWKLYGKDEYSVAITTTISKFASALNNWEETGTVYISKVNYIKHWRNPKIHTNPVSNIFRYKVIAYEFESEVRAILDKTNFDGHHKSLPQGFNCPVDPDIFLRSIVVSPESPAWFFNLVKDITKKYGVNTIINRSKLAFDPDQYK